MTPPIQLGPLNKLVNPGAYAKASAASYDPRIAALIRSMQQGQTTNQQTLGNIKDWFGQLVGQSTGDQHQNTNFVDSLLANRDQSVQGLLGSMGGDVAGTLAKSSLAGGDYIRSLGTNENSYLNNIKGADALQGVESAVKQNQLFDASQHDLLGQVSDARAQKAAAYAQALQQGIGMRHQEAGDLLDAKIKAALAQPQLDAAQLANKAQRQNINVQGQSAADQHAMAGVQRKGAQLQNQATEWQIKHAVDPTSGQLYNWNQLKPADLAGIQKQLQGQVDNGRGQLRVDPITAYNMMGNELRTMSHGKWNPYNDAAVRNYRNQVLQNYMPGWNKAHPKQQYTFINGRLVAKRGPTVFATGK